MQDISITESSSSDQLAVSALDFVGSLVWPGLVLAFFIVYREEIQRFLRALPSARVVWKGLQFILDTSLNEAVALREQIPEKKDSPTGASSVSFHQPWDEDIQIAEGAPRAGIASAWRKLEEEMERYRTNGNLQLAKTPPTLARVIGNNGGLSDAEVQIVYELYKSRNAAIKLDDSKIPPQDAIRFIETARDLTASLMCI